MNVDYYIYPYVLRGIRIHKGLNQKQIGEVLGVSSSRYSNIERGVIKIDATMFYEIISILSNVVGIDVESVAKLVSFMKANIDTSKAIFLSEIKYLGCNFTTVNYSHILNSIKRL